MDYSSNWQKSNYRQNWIIWPKNAECYSRTNSNGTYLVFGDEVYSNLTNDDLNLGFESVTLNSENETN